MKRKIEIELHNEERTKAKVTGSGTIGDLLVGACALIGCCIENSPVCPPDTKMRLKAMAIELHGAGQILNGFQPIVSAETDDNGRA